MEVWAPQVLKIKSLEDFGPGQPWLGWPSWPVGPAWLGSGGSAGLASLAGPLGWAHWQARLAWPGWPGSKSSKDFILELLEPQVLKIKSVEDFGPGQPWLGAQLGWPVWLARWAGLAGQPGQPGRAGQAQNSPRILFWSFWGPKCSK